MTLSFPPLEATPNSIVPKLLCLSEKEQSEEKVDDTVQECQHVGYNATEFAAAQHTDKNPLVCTQFEEAYATTEMCAGRGKVVPQSSITQVTSWFFCNNLI